MYRIKSTSYGKEEAHDFDTEKEAKGFHNMISKWNTTTNIKVIHYTRPIKPSLAPVKGSRGYRRNVFTGWKNIESSTVTKRGFTVTFECYGTATIDPMCDALNGWYTMWTAWRATFKTDGETIQITTHKQNVIDKVFDYVANVGPDSDPECSELELVQGYFRAIANFQKPG